MTGCTIGNLPKMQAHLQETPIVSYDNHGIVLFREVWQVEAYPNAKQFGQRLPVARRRLPDAFCQ